MDEVKKYWLGISPRVYYTRNKSAALLYNTENGSSMKISDNDVLFLLEEMHNRISLGVIEVDEIMLKRTEIATFVSPPMIEDSLMYLTVQFSKSPNGTFSIFCP